MPKKLNILMLASCILSACGQNPDPIAPTTPTTLKITARPDKVDTRTTLADGNTVSFADGDCLAVFDGAGQKRKFTTSAVYGDGSADFMGSISTPADNYIAVYPYQESCLLYNEDVIVRIPDAQTAVAGSFDPSANVSVGCTGSIFGNAGSLQMRNACALLKFSVPEGQSYSTAIILSADNLLTGEMMCTVADEPVLTPTGEDLCDYATLQGKIEGGNWYYIAVRPTVLESGFAFYLFDRKAEIVDLEDYSTVKATTQSVTLQRSGILNLGIIGAEPGGSFEPLDGETIFEW